MASTKEHKRAWYQAHKDDPEYKVKQKAYHAKWQKENAERVNQYKKEWRKKRRAENEQRAD